MKWLLLILTLISCSHVNTLNLKDHRFGEKPKRIVWFQIAGFTEEHIAMLRFGMSREAKRTAFEQMSCSGKIWSYNLFDLRPRPQHGFRSQLFGSANIKGTCGDLQKIPVWTHLNKLGYYAGILENRANESDLEEIEKCGLGDNVVAWSMNTSKRGPYFHYREKQEEKEGRVYFDKSCQRKECHSSFFQNAVALEKKLEDRSSRSFLLLRDFSYYEALKKKDILAANEILLGLEKSIEYFTSKNDEKILVLVTSTSSMNIEFPSKGMEWRKFVREGRGVVFKKSSLLSSVMAKGPGAENFCGIFRESEILPRLFWMSDTSYISKFFSDLL